MRNGVRLQQRLLVAHDWCWVGSKVVCTVQTWSGNLCFANNIYIDVVHCFWYFNLHPVYLFGILDRLTLSVPSLVIRNARRTMPGMYE